MGKFKLIITFIREVNGKPVEYDGTEVWRTESEIRDMFFHPEQYGYNDFFAHRRKRLTPIGTEITYKCEAWTD